MGRNREPQPDNFRPRDVDPIGGQCDYCVHRFEVGQGNTGKCQAFPEGIPEEILLNQVDHRLPYPGDGGIRFKPKEGTPDRYLRPTVPGGEA